ncbi:ATP-binding protein [Microscilla marina]|uniref:AAA superfamily ATPase n=1 Tax=Microscilla marina ATCC 23134 TaxID=313606 RepID=A1ZL13_MICM2|nr:ATP-binding protein [Microscilla marina]EAY28979.1 AAA superfamily ATPase [Microscilla marina ATCC 23134]
MEDSTSFEENYQLLQQELTWVGNVFQRQLQANAAILLESNSLADQITAEEGWKLAEVGEPLTDEEIAQLYRRYGQSDTPIEPIPMPDLNQGTGAYAEFIRKFDFDQTERLVLALALYPHVLPDVLDHWVKTLKDNIAQLPGNIGLAYPHFLPTGKTALFLLAGFDYQQQLLLQHQLFTPSHPFAQAGIITLGKVSADEPAINGTLVVAPEYLHLLTSGKPYRPALSHQFPAKQLTTQQSWEDYVLPPGTQAQVDELLAWTTHYYKLRAHPSFGTDSKGYKCLLYGPSGTGKTMLGRLLAQKTEREVWRIDISQMVSKFVGETSKKIRQVFDTARHYDHILFCDEGEGLFSNRSAYASTAQDTYVNQEVGYLLQAMEDYPGILLVATNNLQNIDQAFMRRFNTSIQFRYPNKACLLKLWQKALAPFELAPGIDLPFIAHTQAQASLSPNEARSQPVTGAQIMAVKDFLGIMALKRNHWKVTPEDLLEALQQKQFSVKNLRPQLLGKVH